MTGHVSWGADQQRQRMDELATMTEIPVRYWLTFSDANSRFDDPRRTPSIRVEVSRATYLDWYWRCFPEQHPGPDVETPPEHDDDHWWVSRWHTGEWLQARPYRKTPIEFGVRGTIDY